jgi:hypothetical protein
MARREAFFSVVMRPAYGKAYAALASGSGLAANEQKETKVSLRNAVTSTAFSHR